MKKIDKPSNRIQILDVGSFRSLTWAVCCVIPANTGFWDTGLDMINLPRRTDFGCATLNPNAPGNKGTRVSDKARQGKAR
jgi:hypothetical protein